MIFLQILHNYNVQPLQETFLFLPFKKLYFGCVIPFYFNQVLFIYNIQN